MDQKTFDYSKFVNEFEIYSLKKKVDKRGKINCSSNELIHPKLKDINKKILNHMDINTINNYIFYPEKMKIFSALLGIQEKRLQLYSGSDDAIKYLLMAFSIKCDSIIIQTPNYENYYSYASLMGYDIKNWVCDSSKLTWDIEKGVEIILGERENSVVVITSPNGFTGGILSKGEIRKLAKMCVIKNDLLIIDQAYLPFANDILYDDLLNEFDNIIFISTLSKGTGLAGARLAYIYAKEIIIDYLSKWNGINSISSLSFQVAELYLREEMFSIVSDIKERRELLTEYINKKTPWVIHDSFANFVLINVGCIAEAKKIKDFFYRKGVIIREITYWEPDGYIRITCIYDIEEIIKIFNEYLESIYNNGDGRNEI